MTGRPPCADRSPLIMTTLHRGWLTMMTVRVAQKGANVHDWLASQRDSVYLRGGWQLSQSFTLFFSFLFLPLFLGFHLSCFVVDFFGLHSQALCSTKVISTYSWPCSAGLIFNNCMVVLEVSVGWHSRFSSPQQPAQRTNGRQAGLKMCSTSPGYSWTTSTSFSMVRQKLFPQTSWNSITLAVLFMFTKEELQSFSLPTVMLRPAHLWERPVS